MISSRQVLSRYGLEGLVVSLSFDPRASILVEAVADPDNQAHHYVIGGRCLTVPLLYTYVQPFLLADYINLLEETEGSPQRAFVEGVDTSTRTDKEVFITDAIRRLVAALAWDDAHYVARFGDFLVSFLP